VEADPDLVLVGEGRELPGHRLRTLQGDADAAQRPGHLEVEVDRLVRLAEGDLVEVDVDARIVVYLAHLGAPGQLRLASFVGRRGRLLPTSPATAAGHSGIGPDGPVHHLDLAEPVL